MSKGLFNSKPLHISQAHSFEIEIGKFFNHINVDRNDWAFIGSFGKKEFSGDVDIAVLEKMINFNWLSKWIIGRLEHKIVKGFNQISFGYPFEGQTVQVDLMLTDSLEWSKFIYYSPDLSRLESKFNGTYRNALLSDYVVQTTRKFEDENQFTQLSIKMNEGLVKTTKTFLSKSGNKLKTPRILHCEFLSNEPDKVLEMIELKNPIDTFEQLYEQIKLKSNFEEVWQKFEQSCKNLKLEIPKL